MKEREPDFEDEKIRAWLRRPAGAGLVEEEGDLRVMEEDPTVMTIDEETEDILESRAYHFRPGPETFSFFLASLAQAMGDGLAQMPPGKVTRYILHLAEGAVVKFLAKRRKEGGRISFILIGLSHYARSLLDRQELVGESDYRRAVQESEALPLSRMILSEPAVVSVEEWRRYFEEGSLPGGQGQGG